MGLPAFDADSRARELIEMVGPEPSWRRMLGDWTEQGIDHVRRGFWRDLALAAHRTAADDPGFEGRTWIATDESGSLAADTGLHWFAKFMEARANSYYGRLLVDAPILRLQLGGPGDWATGRPPAWGAVRGNETWVPLHGLSDAERRWADVAIELALQRDEAGFLLIDEPERALHRSAERFMAQGLAEIADERGLAVVAATHSPELLDAPDAHVYLVRRSDQGMSEGHQVHPLDDAVKDDLLEFGLLPSDLLRRQRGFLFVEGQHDLVVLDELVGPELAAMRIEMLPMRGAGKLAATLDSRVLYDFTDAHMFVMLDALRSDEITEIWDDSIRLAKTASVAQAVSSAADRLSKITVDEAGAFSAFITRALERGLAERHTPLTLSAPDILDYLPVVEFVPGATSWQSLRDELTKSQGSTPSGNKFKAWLRSAKRADLSDDHIRRACQAMDHIPEEFTAHLERMRVILAAR